MLWYSLEAPRWGASNEYSHHMFSMRNKYYLDNPLSGFIECIYTILYQPRYDKAQRHARLLAEQIGWWNSYLCRQKGYEEALWCTKESIWSPELRNSRMQQISTYSNGKGILKSVTIIGASLYCQLLVRALQESYWIDWMNILNSQDFYQKASVDTGRTKEQLTWSSQEDSFKRNARNSMWTSTWPMLTLPEHLTTVSREGLWKIMAMVRQFHDGMLARVQNDGEFSDPFPLTNGVKQDCVLASKLFSMMFSAMLTDAFQDGDNGIPIRYRFDEKHFNRRRGARWVPLCWWHS